ncbi:MULTISPECIES: phosphoribosylpyrophosphate synthetase [unclassified Mucilaginibacter]|uniref:phosphoribosylpyrophosphate synthetase n=1 Tax=unclassified Mucilaginibacter TaxID=2617802 RepID=UPI002AC9C5C6|nr:MULTISPECIES: phosphoribosylpyrophosphate synthetase [unclassified Mucilaginibacter]MEB0260270.1 phosphoribosylpyrophosphate synthetase [Mucilaginibacter sp. 10I4]MEB0277319.1 phosphoribosylpyrophosphate synthetase [Mucilaginibacter sp. 10B2]MEB0302170.1 phosphoribosylpyrophosphate synthetase [Mucilaginibacter sp. 5C4]WPX25445.1 phosphoribosylpyrophosphate synthetase [Mucilaginibacter sp. 5C4]
MKTDYGTLSQTINGLKEEGYTLDFNIRHDCIICQDNQVQLSPADFEIDGVFRFEGESNPDDEAVLYAISSTKDGSKGTLVNGYGVSADAASDELIKKLSTHVK